MTAGGERSSKSAISKIPSNNEWSLWYSKISENRATTRRLSTTSPMLFCFFFCVCKETQKRPDLTQRSKVPLFSSYVSFFLSKHFFIYIFLFLCVFIMFFFFSCSLHARWECEFEFWVWVAFIVIFPYTGTWKNKIMFWLATVQHLRHTFRSAVSLVTLGHLRDIEEPVWPRTLV